MPLSGLVWVFLLVLVRTDLTFEETDFFIARQTRFFPTSDSTIFAYSLPVPFPANNLSSAALVLSGYDLQPSRALNFKANLSVNYISSTFQVLVETANQTKFYSLNFFLISISKEASSWLSIQTYCFQTSVSSYNPQLFKYSEQHFMQGPFNNLEADQVRVIPYISSIHSEVYKQGNYLNLSSAGTKANLADIYVNVYRDISFFISACVSMLVVKEQYISLQPLTAYAYGGRQTMRGTGGSTLESLAANNFGVKYAYGPVFQPKCLIGFHAVLIQSATRGNLNFDISEPGVSMVTSSTGYMVDFSYFCLAKITCPHSGYQYYSLIGDCQPACAIENCVTCSSSTSCSVCNATYYVDALSRCSKCMSNCVTCSDIRSCTECAMGYYYAAGVCQVCAVYCVKCIQGSCTQCQYGYTPNGTMCVSCRVIMPYCLDCPNPAQCTTCVDTYVFSSNFRACKLCGELMANCSTCNYPNNCLKCQNGFYLYSFSSCRSCSYTVDACCPNYVANCTSCASEARCKTCQSGFRTSNLTGLCEPCQQIFGLVCTGCDANSCYECQKGYYVGGGQCNMCNQTIPRCLDCKNGSFCASCSGNLIFAGGRCLDCPSWPLNSIYYIDNASICQSCSVIDPYCQTCSPEGLCLSCSDLHYLSSGACHLCADAMSLCLACKDGQSCSLCQKGYFLDLSQKNQCLFCYSSIDHCLECSMEYDPLTKQSRYLCSKCEPLYYPSLATGQCALCSSSLSNCLRCVNAASCLICMDNYYLNADYLCAACGKILPGCQTCLSLSVCGTCQEGYVLQGSYCSSCGVVIHYCQSCGHLADSSVGCNRCQQGYYLSSLINCASCKDKDELCTQCTSGKCTQCVSTYYATSAGKCKPCNQLIPNCLYCSPDLICLSCMPNIVFFPSQHSCKTCNQSIPGCSNCTYTIDTTTQAPKVVCSSCQDQYLPFALPDSTMNCISCSSAIMYCELCTTLTLCAKCQNMSFINPDGTCSRCSLYLPNCQLCNSSSTCLSCASGFSLDSTSRCVECDLSLFGVGEGQNLCNRCDASTNQAICSQCISSAYLSPNKDRCTLCKQTLPNCKTCQDPYLCTECLQAYYFSTNTLKCLSCPFQLCSSCTITACLSCLPTAMMANGQCRSCGLQLQGCSQCSSSQCLLCQDGYYLNDGKCVSCGSIESTCVLCSGGICKLSDPNRQNSTTTYKAISLISIVLVMLVSLFAIISCCCKSKENQLQEQPKAETSRRMSEDEIYENEMQIKSTKICHFCNTSKPRYMKVELLCRTCEGKTCRGEQHKIIKDLKKDFVDRIKQDVSIREEEKGIGMREGIEMKNREGSRGVKEGQLGIYSAVPKKKEEEGQLPSTKATSSKKSKHIRDMF